MLLVNGSLLMTPLFSRSGPDESSPTSQVILRCYDFPARIQAVHPVPLPGPGPRPNQRSLAFLPVSSMLPPLRGQRRLQRVSYFGAIARLQHLLPTLQDWCCHHPCKARFRLAGWPLPGGSRTLWIALKGFRSHFYSPFLDFSWRYRDELPAHWIASSAVANSVSGMVRPSAVAVLRLMTSSKWIGCSTGIS
jgi:hypothetical protein